MAVERQKTGDRTVAKVLLTGASGFIGQALLQRLSARGIATVVIGRSAPAAVPGVSFAAANLDDPSSLRRALKSPICAEADTIIHLAVSRHHREFPQKALDLFYVNAAAAAELLDHARTAGIARAIFGSTGTVYSASAVAGTEVKGNSEGEFNRPSSYFAASKLFADTLCDFYRSMFPIATLRLYAPYGPGLTDRMLNDLVARVREGRPLSLPANGPGLGFAALYIDDALTVIDAALNGGWNETVNIAAPEQWTIQSAGALIGTLVGRDAIFERSTAASAPMIVPDTTRLGQLLPNHAFTGLEAGLRAMISAQPAG